MKVYNKNDLIGGINRIWMSVIWIALAVGEKGKTQWICAGLLVVSSIVLIMRAVKKPSAGEQIAALDERNQMIDLKSKSRTYDIMNVLDVVLMMIFIVLGKYWDISAISFGNILFTMFVTIIAADVGPHPLVFKFACGCVGLVYK